MTARCFPWCLLLASFLGLLSGCAGYRWGQQTLYRSDIRTVHVPIFQSESFRRGLGERLTEAVVKQIELTTPFRVVDADQADSVLLGRILGDGFPLQIKKIWQTAVSPQSLRLVVGRAVP